MKVVCIKNTYKGTHMDLTYGKVYEVIDQHPFQINVAAITLNKMKKKIEHQIYQIDNDKGALTWYDREVVMPLDEWREERLKELGV